MKTFIKMSFMVMITIIAFNSCKKDVRALDLTVAPVTTLTAPDDNASIDLQPATGSSIVFKWDASATQDLVLYEVAFDKVGGDFSKPVFKVLSDGSGVQAQATITQKQLNTIASMAGIASSTTGSLKWAVIVSKATNAKLSTTSHLLQVTRPAGFAVLPDSLYVTGSATEHGTDASKAIAFKKTGDGVFELYTSLQAGTYSLIDKTTGTPTTYSIQNNINVVANGSTTVAGNKAVYRIDVDLSNAAATITQIVSVGFWSAPDGKIWFTLPYIGNSQWEMDNWPLVITQESYGADSRYKYQFTVINSAGVQSTEWYGSINSDNPDPSSTTPASYWYMYLVDNSQFNYCFKILPADNNKNVNVNVNFSPGLPTYNNTISIH
jgi:hypothetical protein